MSSIKNSKLSFSKYDKIAILITLTFLIITASVAFLYHDFFHEHDAVWFLFFGEQLVQEGPKNVESFDAPPGGPLLFVLLNSLFNDGFFTVKLVSVLSATGIIFLSYHIIKNLFNPKVALVGQLLFVFCPRFDYLSVSALNELLPVFLIFLSLYIVTKKILSKYDAIIIGLLLGLAFLIRYQSMLIILGISIVLLIRNKEIFKNFKLVVLISICFIIIITPLLAFNYNSYGTLLDSNSNNYIAMTLDFDATQLEQIQKKVVERSSDSWIFIDFELFLENYFYNILYNNPSKLFNFNDLDNLSIIPIIPFIGFFSMICGLLYILKPKLNKKRLLYIFLPTLFTFILIIIFGNIQIHFFALFLVPIVLLTILEIKRIDQKFLTLLILPTVFFVIISIIPLYRSYQLLPIFIFIVALNSVFLVEVLPKFISKIKPKFFKNKYIILLPIITLILLTNFAFSFKLTHDSLNGIQYEGFENTIEQFLVDPFPQKKPNAVLEISQILMLDPDIKNSYVMGNILPVSYYSDSKFVYTEFTEGDDNDSIISFIERENWSDYEIYKSNNWSRPIDRNNQNNPIPDYLVYSFQDTSTNTIWSGIKSKNNTSSLSNPTDPLIPKNFEVIYISDDTKIIVYKIHHNED